MSNESLNTSCLQARIAHECVSPRSAIKLLKYPALKSSIVELEHHLLLGNTQFMERVCQKLMDQICLQLSISTMRVHVLDQRPHDESSELHGLYEPVDQVRPRARIYVWMRTAKKQQIVAFKTFLLTLVHELCHHLDYEYFKLEDSLHTPKFFQRESMIVKYLIG